MTARSERSGPRRGNGEVRPARSRPASAKSAPDQAYGPRSETEPKSWKDVIDRGRADILSSDESTDRYLRVSADFRLNATLFGAVIGGIYLASAYGGIPPSYSFVGMLGVMSVSALVRRGRKWLEQRRPSGPAEITGGADSSESAGDGTPVLPS